VTYRNEKMKINDAAVIDIPFLSSLQSVIQRKLPSKYSKPIKEARLFKLTKLSYLQLKICIPVKIRLSRNIMFLYLSNFIRN